MAQLPRPPQLSTDPAVNASAMQWANQFLTALEKILNGTDPGLTFLKLVALGDHKAAFGSATLTWPGGAPAVATTITHGLGATPALVLVSCTLTSGGQAVAAYISAAPGATTFGAGGYAQGGNPALGATATIFWLALV